MPVRLLRILLLITGLLATAATSIRSPYYPRLGPHHEGAVYIRNTTAEVVPMEIARLRADRSIDCAAVTAGAISHLARGDFAYPPQWKVRPGENVPLHDARMSEKPRDCYAAVVRVAEREWVVAWRHGQPATHAFPHETEPNAPMTPGGIRLVPRGPSWALDAPAGVTVTPVDTERQASLLPEPPRRKPTKDAVGASLYASSGFVSDSEQLGDTDTTLAAGLRMRGIAGGPVGLATGVDIDLGSTSDGGFLYNLNMHILGIGAHKNRIAAGLVIGGGFSGITGDRAGFAWQVPVELFASYRVTRMFRLSAWGRTQWIFSEDARQDGAPSAPFGDELHAGIGIDVLWAIGPRPTPGLSLSLTYSELLDTEVIGITIGGAVWSQHPALP